MTAIADPVCKNAQRAKLVSVQGKVLFDATGKGQWHQAELDEEICQGGRVRVESYSRASLSLSNGVVLRLDEGTVLSLNGIALDEPTFLDLVKGFIHFISRSPRHLEITSPIANAGPEGTEFAMQVDDARASLWVYEGGVRFFNPQGSIHLKPGQGAKALSGQAPHSQIEIKPRDAVNWALYYPPILPYPASSAQIDESIRAAITDYRQGRIDDALLRMDTVPPDQRTPFFYKVRAAQRLTAGRVGPAREDIRAIFASDPNDAEALALESILALTQNQKEEALRLANRSVQSNPASSTAYSALSYAEQGAFELDKALAAAEQAVQYAPHDAMVWARKAELELAKGTTTDSEESAQRALELDPGLERTQTVRGFTYLLRMETADAKKSFEQAVQLDSTSPLARLGLGLAKIRDGDLEEGRHDLEIAAILDPNNSLMRSYLGKAYYEERRSTLASDQFDLAKERDPKDPTPYFYDALKKQTENRPIEALHDLQKAITLNNNRAVYRSKQLLDADRAARGASLARIYDTLGFEQRGVVEAISSLQTDPTNFSAHRFLSDSYVNLSSRETAQVSELLQAKMLQPININPVQPHLAVSQRGLLSASGIANSSFKDFTRVFEGNRPQLLVSGVVGNQGVLGDEATLSGIVDRFSYSLGQYHYETDGFFRPYGNPLDRNNTSQRHNIYDAFLQWAITDGFNAQFEYINRLTSQGNLLKYISSRDTMDYSEKDFLREQFYRAGFNLQLFSDDRFLASYIHNDSFTRILVPNFSEDTRNRIDLDLYEGQYLRNQELYNFISGFSIYNVNLKTTEFGVDKEEGRGANGHREYVYLNLKIAQQFIGTLGVTHDFINDKSLDVSMFSPKVGLLWDINERIKLRLAYFKENIRPVTAIQTIEPTQVAGFNQFFDIKPNNYFAFYGGAIDMAFSPSILSGIEFSRQDIYVLETHELYFRIESSKFYF
ncbi:MAG: tetratricopeptide repeat protein, partial [Methylococcales bacterium]